MAFYNFLSKENIWMYINMCQFLKYIHAKQAMCSSYKKSLLKNTRLWFHLPAPIRFTFQTPFSFVQLPNIIKPRWEIPHKKEIKLTCLHHTMLVYNELVSFWINVSTKPKFLEIQGHRWGSRMIFFMIELSFVVFFY